MASETLAESSISGNPRKAKRLHLLLYGPPGSGKTVIAHTLPRTRTLDLDDGMQSVEWAVREGIIDRDLSDIVKATILPPMDDRKNNVLQEAMDQVDEWMEEEDEWDTIIVDSASALTESSMILGMREGKRLGVSKSYDGIRGGLTARAMRQQDWGAASSLFEKFVKYLKTLGKNIVIICHEYHNTNSDGGTISIDPMVIGQLRQRLPAMFDEVWYVSTKGSRKKVKRELQTEPDSLRQCKSRLGCLDAVEPADFNAIKAKVAEFYGVDPDKLWTSTAINEEVPGSGI